MGWAHSSNALNNKYLILVITSLGNMLFARPSRLEGNINVNYKVAFYEEDALCSKRDNRS